MAADSQRSGRGALRYSVHGHILGRDPMATFVPERLGSHPAQVLNASEITGETPVIGFFLVNIRL